MISCQTSVTFTPGSSGGGVTRKQVKHAFSSINYVQANGARNY